LAQVAMGSNDSGLKGSFLSNFRLPNLPSLWPKNVGERKTMSAE
jgi:hypothetical protein